MSTEERVLRLENAFFNLEVLVARSDQRTSELERHFQILTQLAVNASERADTHESWINSLGTRMEELAASQQRLDKRMEELAEAQKQTGANLSALNVIVADLGRTVGELGRRVDGLSHRFDELGRTVEGLSHAVDGLVLSVSDLRTTVAEIGRAQVRTDNALASLTEKLDRYIDAQSH